MATETPGDIPTARPLRGLYLAVLLGAGALFCATAQRGVAWQDSGVFQLRIARFDLAGERGLALAHPLLIVLGRAAAAVPWGPMAWRINLLSAVCGAVAAANLAALVRRLRPDRPVAAWLAAGWFATAHCVWWLATICESHALLAALLTAELHVVVSLARRPTWRGAAALGLLNGLGLAKHNLALLAAPGYMALVCVLCARRRLGWWSPAVLAGAWAAGAGLYLGLIVQAAGQRGGGEAVRSALFGRQWQGQVLGFSARALVLGVACLVYSFPNAVVPWAAAGVWRLRRAMPPAAAGTVGYLLAAHLLFAVRYGVGDQFMFFVPTCVLLALLAGLGVGGAAGPRRKVLIWLAAASVAAGPILYAAAPAVWRRLGGPTPGRADLPYRDPEAYWLRPWKSGEEYDPERR